MTTPLNTTLMEELTTSLGGCIGTLEMALAVVEDGHAQRALIACLSVISTSYEHLCRVDAMAFSEPAPTAPGEPLTMGQPEGGECLHLDLTPLPVMGAVQFMCSECGATVEVPGE